MLPVLPAFAVLLLLGALALLWLLVSAVFLLWGARLAGIGRRSFGRAIGTLLIGGMASALLSAALGAAPLAGPGLGLLLGFFVSSVVMMAIFDTTFGKALVANILAWVLPFLVAGGVALLGFALMGLVVALA